MEILTLLIITPPLAILCGLFVGGIETALQLLDGISQRKNRIKELNKELSSLKENFKKIDSSEEFSIKRGIIEAQILNCAYEMEILRLNK